MINIKYNNNELNVYLSDEISSVLKKEDLPLILNIVDNANNIHFSNKNLNIGHFSNCFDVSYKNVVIYTSTGIKIFDWSWSVMIDGDLSHKLFHIWSKKNLGTPGLVIGAHNGTSGEWVGPVMNGELRAILIEPSDKSYNDLKSKYEDRGLIHLEKSLITVDGSDISFYECDSFQDGQINSVYIDNLLYHVDPSQIVEKKIKSQTILDILTKYDLGDDKWWLQIDAEGLDYDLITKSDFGNKRLPSCLIFESKEDIPVSGVDNKNDLESWLLSKNYTCYQSNFNKICFLDV